MAELTELGQQAAGSFVQKDNPRFHCETTSIIFDWTFDGPVNRISQNKDTILLQYGQMGLKRTIYTGMTTHPVMSTTSVSGGGVTGPRPPMRARSARRCAAAHGTPCSASCRSTPRATSRCWIT